MHLLHDHRKNGVAMPHIHLQSTGLITLMLSLALGCAACARGPEQIAQKMRDLGDKGYPVLQPLPARIKDAPTPAEQEAHIRADVDARIANLARRADHLRGTPGG